MVKSNSMRLNLFINVYFWFITQVHTNAMLCDTAMYKHLFVFVIVNNFACLYITVSSHNAVAGTRELHLFGRWLSGSPIIRPSVKFVDKSTKLTCPEISGYRQVQYSVMASRNSNQLWSRRIDAYSVYTVTCNDRTSYSQYSLLSNIYPVIRIFCISSWLAASINPDKWISTLSLSLSLCMYVCSARSQPSSVLRLPLRQCHCSTFCSIHGRTNVQIQQKDSHHLFGETEISERLTRVPAI
jgi:hypothetical protein